MPDLSRKQFLLLAVIFVAASLLIYSGVSDHQLLNWDDRSYTVNNPWVTNPTPANLASIFTESRMANWHPLTWLSFIPEYALCGDTAVCYKTTNAVLHGLVSLFVAMLCANILNLAGASDNRQTFSISKKVTVSWPLLVGTVAGLLFLVHPQHVESVTWVAQRKDLLCALFYLAALIFYCQAHRRSYLHCYGLCFLLFLLAAMSKSMAVSLPLALLLLDVFVLHPGILQSAQRSTAIRILVIEKLPFYLLMLLLILLTLTTQSASDYAPLGMWERLGFVSAGIRHYLQSFLLPLNLSPFYPASLAELTLINIAVTIVFLAASLLLAWLALSANRFRLPALALLFFLVTVAPVIGIVRIGEQAFADRYSYIPLCGFFMLAAWATAKAALRTRILALASLPLLALLVVLGALSASYKHSWRNDVSFWSTVVNHYPDAAAMPLDNLANAWAVSGDYERAIAAYHRSIAIEPTQAMSYINLAIVQQFTGDADVALQTLEQGVAANPDNPALLSRTGRALLQRGELDRAEAMLEKAISLRPDLPDTLLSMGLLRRLQGRDAEAIELLERIPANMPQHYEANLQILDVLIGSDRSAASTQLQRLRSLYGTTPELEQLATRLEAR